MSNFGKSIRLFLIEGETSGRWKCELSNWTGLAFKVPRMLISKCTDRPELQYTGVYFLIGKSDDQSDNVYIGEAEEVLKRLNQHIANDEWQDWTECIVFVSRDNELNKAQAKYLESSLYTLAVKAGRCRLMNMNRPTKSSLSEPDRAEMEEFLYNLRILLGAMGHRFLEPPITTEEESEGTVFHMSGKIGYDARGMPVSDGFVVLKGSRISDTVSNSFKSSGYYKLREKLIAEGTIVDGIFTKDCHFDSYSASSGVVQGRSSNGWIEWKTENGDTLDAILGKENAKNSEILNSRHLEADAGNLN